MKQAFCILAIFSSLFLYSCRAQDVVISFGEFKKMIEKKEVDKVIFHKGTSMVTIINDGKAVDFEHNMDNAEGRAITRALSKANILYKTRRPSSD